ncbi:hypothetical protein Kisp01_68090 [Kineosporia sp. NBRC 101677]|nr:hypothetical protein Kisp01_68090 [Kineosporia sp. NBRC 101677]
MADEHSAVSTPKGGEPIDSLPEGWRWESYRDVRLAVPADWGYGVTPSRMCRGKTETRPHVGRPVVNPEGGRCETSDERYGSTGQFVWFGVEEPAMEVVRLEKVKGRAVVHRGRAAIQVGMVRVYVRAPEPIRQQILNSIEFTDIDHNSCPAQAPYAGDPSWRPDGPDVTKYQEIRSISACRYADAELVSSLRLTGEKATDALAAIARAPEGGGPFHPAASCVPVEVEAEGIEQLVLQVDAATSGTISLRYGGCSSTGLDDGVTVRTLTRDSVTPFLQGPNRPTQDYWALMTL